MLRASSFAVKVIAWILLRQHDATHRAERCLACEAAHMIIATLSHHHIFAAGALAGLISSTGEIHELCKKLRFVCSRLRPVHTIAHHLLVPPPNLIIIK